MLTFKEYRLLEESRELQILDEGVLDQIKDTFRDLFGKDTPGVSADKISKIMAQAPKQLPDPEMAKLVNSFLKQKEIQKKLEQAEYDKKSVYEKIRPVLFYFTDALKNRWNRLTPTEKNRIYRDLQNFMMRALKFVLDILLAALKK